MAQRAEFSAQTSGTTGIKQVARRARNADKRAASPVASRRKDLPLPPELKRTSASEPVNGGLTINVSFGVSGSNHDPTLRDAVASF
jgi:hypothetical protein